MPSSTASICRTCSKRTVLGTSYCADHSEAQHKAEYEAARATLEHRKMYNTARWRLVRANVLRTQPLCAECGHRAAQVVHHVVDAVAWMAKGESFFDRTNLQGLCTSCHNVHTARTAGWGRKN